MDPVEVLIITPCVGGVDLGGTGERRKQCASATTTHRLDLSQESMGRGRKTRGEEGEMFRDSARGGGCWLFTSITGEAAQRLGRGRQLLPPGTKQVRVSTRSAP